MEIIEMAVHDVDFSVLVLECLQYKERRGSDHIQIVSDDIEAVVQ